MEELRFQVVVDSRLDREVDGVLAFGDFVSGGDAVVYPDDPTALSCFFLDPIQGRPYPLTLVIRSIHTVGHLVSVALFLHRDLAIHPAMPALVMAASLVDELKLAGLAHIDRDLARFFQLLEGYLPPNLSKKAQQERLGTAVGWIRQYVLDGQLPALPVEPAPPRILDVGTNGFVLAESVLKVSLESCWVELYRQGFLRGAVYGQPRKDGHRRVLVARKSTLLAFDLRKVADILNEAETAMGEPPGWVASSLWLKSDSTLLKPEDVTKVLVRV